MLEARATSGDADRTTALAGQTKGDGNAASLALSVVIPTFNRARLLRDCLESLGRQTAPAESYEVVVVDDGSTDDTGSVLDGLETPYRLVTSRQANAGAGAARNRGAMLAGGRTCLFLDDDTVAEPTLIGAHQHAHAEASGIVGLGHMNLRLQEPADACTRWFDDWWRRHYARLADGRVTFRDCYSGNLSVPRDEFLAAEGFAEDLRRLDDYDLGFRVHKRGLSFRYLPGARSTQFYPGGLDRITADAEESGRASVTLLRREPGSISGLDLGRFHSGSVWAVQLRRVLLATRVPAALLRRLDPVLAGRSRWYPFLLSYFYWSAVRGAADDDLWRRLSSGTRILLYHAVAAEGEAGSRYVIPVDLLERQLDLLHERRVPVISLDELLDLRAEGRLPPAGATVITFDDAYTDFATLALPALEQRGFPAAIFVSSGAVGASNQWDVDGPTASRPVMSWETIRGLAGRGSTVGAHGVEHRRLAAVSEGEARAEIEGSVAAIEAATGELPRAFAYPYGSMNEDVARLVEQAGLAAACSTVPGINDPNTSPFALRRAEIEGTAGLLRFRLALLLGDAFPERSLTRRLTGLWHRLHR